MMGTDGISAALAKVLHAFLTYLHPNTSEFAHVRPSSSPAQVLHKGAVRTYKFIVLGTKGDWPFLRASFNLNCGFNCSDKCHRCKLPETSP